MGSGGGHDVFGIEPLELVEATGGRSPTRSVAESVLFRSGSAGQKSSGAGAFHRHHVIGIHQLTALERETPTPDAGSEVVANALHVLDLGCEYFVPSLGDLRPIALFRGPLQREFIEYRLDVCERDAYTLGCANESKPSENVSVVPALVPGVSRAGDEPLAFIEMQRGTGYSAALAHLANGEQIRRFERLWHPKTIVLDLNLS